MSWRLKNKNKNVVQIVSGRRAKTPPPPPLKKILDPRMRTYGISRIYKIWFPPYWHNDGTGLRLNNDTVLNVHQWVNALCLSFGWHRMNNSPSLLWAMECLGWYVKVRKLYASYKKLYFNNKQLCGEYTYQVKFTFSVDIVNSIVSVCVCWDRGSCLIQFFFCVLSIFCVPV